MKPHLTRWFALGFAAALGAQDKPYLGRPQSDQDALYSFQLRVNRAGSGLDPLVSNRNGGGGRFSALFGSDPFRLRIRMDGDAFPGKDGQGRVSTFGLGVEGVFFFSAFDQVTPYISLGPAAQHWDVLQAQTLPTRSKTTNHLAGRAEFGFRFGRSATLSIGVLAGSIGNGATTANPYIAVAF